MGAHGYRCSASLDQGLCVCDCHSMSHLSRVQTSQTTSSLSGRIPNNTPNSKTSLVTGDPGARWFRIYSGLLEGSSTGWGESHTQSVETVLQVWKLALLASGDAL